jgi:hypothetical protein
LYLIRFQWHSIRVEFFRLWPFAFLLRLSVVKHKQTKKKRNSIFFFSFLVGPDQFHFCFFFCFFLVFRFFHVWFWRLAYFWGVIFF